jgi:hypothetical protein
LLTALMPDCSVVEIAVEMTVPHHVHVPATAAIHVLPAVLLQPLAEPVVLQLAVVALHHVPLLLTAATTVVAATTAATTAAATAAVDDAASECHGSACLASVGVVCSVVAVAAAATTSATLAVLQLNAATHVLQAVQLQSAVLLLAVPLNLAQPEVFA